MLVRHRLKWRQIGNGKMGLESVERRRNGGVPELRASSKAGVVERECVCVCE